MDFRRHVCLDCGVRLYNGHRGKKHAKKTGHAVGVNWRAENAVRKYRAGKTGYTELIEERMGHPGYILDEG